MDRALRRAQVQPVGIHPGDRPAAPVPRRRVLRTPVLGFVLAGPFLLGPLVLAVRAALDPAVFAGTGSSVAFQWVVTGGLALLALAVGVSMLRSRFVVAWDRVTRVRGLRRAVTVRRAQCRRVGVVAGSDDVRFDDRRRPPTVTVYSHDGREVSSAHREAEARVLLPVLLDWVLEAPALVQDPQTARFFADYERFLAGEVVRHPAR